MKRIFLVAISTILFFPFTQAQDATAISVYNEALASQKAKEYGKAYELYMKAIEMSDPAEDEQVLRLSKKNGAIAAYYYGGALTKEDKLDDALAIHQKGIELNPEFYANYVGQGKVYNSQGMIKDAVTFYCKAGEVRTAAGQADKAETYYKRANNIIAVAYSKKKVDETIEACQVFVEARSESADPHYFLGKAFFDKGSKPEALEHAEKAVELGGDADEGKYIFSLAEILEGSGQKSKALQTYAKVPQGKYYEVARYKIDQAGR